MQLKGTYAWFWQVWEYTWNQGSKTFSIELKAVKYVSILFLLKIWRIPVDVWLDQYNILKLKWIHK